MDTFQETIDRLVRQIVDLLHPIKIILFGSAARGQTAPDSDVDLLVVVPEGSHRRRTAQRLYKQINNAGVPFDLIVATPVDLEKRKDDIGMIYRSILREGKEVYAA